MAVRAIYGRARRLALGMHLFSDLVLKTGRLGWKPNLLDQHLGNRLRHFREASSVSTEVAASSIDVSTRALARIEGGKKRVSPKHLFVLAKIYNVSVGSFFRIEEATS